MSVIAPLKIVEWRVCFAEKASQEAMARWYRPDIAKRGGVQNWLFMLYAELEPGHQEQRHLRPRAPCLLDDLHLHALSSWTIWKKSFLALTPWGWW